ncbi:hypothetical protein BGW36DRAFT_464621 [Talaromyces proteolyticus]|uniref:Zn(2)-C6 fungal-type domain-containing protein n=1 Tax=Talaromyces proteolyticus TaxID=1131652 RepID=A0AAD4KGT6_9EURO|nr:uncharacterized protein BGW36DRAFT_464621 [Talaromyces proteolyticus]KAH8692043.1 hypothetical protein BGW36DRAFT_464621 [Talaromyces proteolyticus]
MDSDSDAVAKRACNACRAKKTRCVASRDVPGVCKRCQQKKVECVTRALKPAARRDRLYNRIAHLEKEMENVKSRLPAEQLQHPPPAASQQSEISITPPISRIHAQDSQNSNNHTSSIQLQPDVLTKQALTLEQADLYLNRFRKMSQFCPYVVLPENATIADLRLSNPFLLLAILASASTPDRPLQVWLSHEFLQQLSETYVVKGEKSLDMLQGLLVYVTWYHLHFKSINRLLAIAVSIAIELGINRRPLVNEKEQVAVKFSSTLSHGLRNSGPDFWSLEARRAFIGCYVLSLMYSSLQRKVNTMKYTSYLEDCAVSIATEYQVLSDLTLPHYLRIARYFELVGDAFGYNLPNNNQDKLSEETIQFYIRSFDSQLQELVKSATQPMNTILTLWHRVADIYTHEIGLYGIVESNISIKQTEILFNCTTAAHKFLDSVLIATKKDVDYWPTFLLSQIHYTVTIVTKLTLGVRSPTWNAAEVRNIIKLELYINEICHSLLPSSHEPSHQLPQQIRAQNDPLYEWQEFITSQWHIAKARYSEGLKDLGILIAEPSSTEPSSLTQAYSTADEQYLSRIPQMGISASTDIDIVDFLAADNLWFMPNSSIDGLL